jgi:hypothetical protein
MEQNTNLEVGRHAMPLTTQPFLLTMIAFLEPYFVGVGMDITVAQAEIVQTLASYGTRSRSEIINAAKIIAFDMSTLDTLREAATTEMSPSLRLRYRSCANGLNRSSQQNEKTLAVRLACDLHEIAEPVNDVSDATAQEAVQQAQATIDTTRNRLFGGTPRATGVHAQTASERPESQGSVSKMRGSPLREGPMPEFGWPAVVNVTPEQEARTKEMWGDAMIKVLGDMGRPVQPIAASA